MGSTELTVLIRQRYVTTGRPERSCGATKRSDTAPR
jgi:hypothetical protein